MAAALRDGAVRGLGLFVAWLLIAGPDPTDFAVGIVTAALAAWASLVLLPAGEQRLRLRPLLVLAARLIGQSVVGGVDVSRRAFARRVRLNPGFVTYRATLAAGAARSAFATEMSLVPGTLPVDLAPDGTLTVHCLDTAQPVAAVMAREEAMLRRVLHGEAGDG
jgi:multicomponent Na+:H+ antiporter subunit E